MAAFASIGPRSYVTQEADTFLPGVVGPITDYPAVQRSNLDNWKVLEDAMYANQKLSGRSLPKAQMDALVAQRGAALGYLPRNLGTPEPLPLPKFTVTKTVKQPEIASAVTTALKTPFDQLLTESKAALSAQAVKSQAALDTTGVDKELREINRSYEADAGTNLDEVRARNAAYADEARKYVESVQANTADTGTRLASVRDKAYAEGVKRSNLSLLGSGTQAGSGANSNRLNRAYLDAALPYEMQLGQIRRADLTDVLRPTQQQNFQNDQNYLILKANLDDKFRGNRTATAQYLQSLRMNAAQMSSAELAQALGLQQQLQTGAITNLGLLQRLDALANEYTFNTPYQDRTPATPNYTPIQPRRNYVGGDVYPPQGGSGNSASVNSGGRSYGPSPSVPGFYGDPGYAPTDAEFSLSQYRNPTAPEYMGGGVYDLPNNYTWGRNASQQQVFEDLQRSYE